MTLCEKYDKKVKELIEINSKILCEKCGTYLSVRILRDGIEVLNRKKNSIFSHKNEFTQFRCSFKVGAKEILNNPTDLYHQYFLKDLGYYYDRIIYEAGADKKLKFISVQNDPPFSSYFYKKDNVFLRLTIGKNLEDHCAFKSGDYRFVLICRILNDR